MSPIISRAGFSFGFGRRRGGKVILPFFATGGTVATITGTDSKSYKSHTFITPGTFVVNATDPSYINKFYIETVGSGGGGGRNNFGNGGGGGGSGTSAFFSNVSFITIGTNPITVSGGGGPGGPGGPTNVVDTTSTTIVNAAGGNGAPGQGGAGGGSTPATSIPTITIGWSYSAGGGTGPGRPPDGNDAGGGGGNAWGSPSYNPGYLFYQSPSQINNRGGGGGGAGSGDPDAQIGGPGAPGACIIYYPVDII
jgi:hypothetical protein